MKDYTNKDCCLNCEGFCWWDGDYCCTKHMEIHQYGYGNKNGGYTSYPFMNEDIDNTMETTETCEDYDKITYNPKLNQYIDQYKKFKEFDKLCKQLYNHVHNKYK